MSANPTLGVELTLKNKTKQAPTLRSPPHRHTQLNVKVQVWKSTVEEMCCRGMRGSTRPDLYRAVREGFPEEGAFEVGLA